MRTFVLSVIVGQTKRTPRWEDLTKRKQTLITGQWFKIKPSIFCPKKITTHSMAWHSHEEITVRHAADIEDIRQDLEALWQEDLWQTNSNVWQSIYVEIYVWSYPFASYVYASFQKRLVSQQWRHIFNILVLKRSPKTLNESYLICLLYLPICLWHAVSKLSIQHTSMYTRW